METINNRTNESTGSDSTSYEQDLSPPIVNLNSTTIENVESSDDELFKTPAKRRKLVKRISSSSSEEEEEEEVKFWRVRKFKIRKEVPEVIIISD